MKFGISEKTTEVVDLGISFVEKGKGRKHVRTDRLGESRRDKVHEVLMR